MDRKFLEEMGIEKENIDKILNKYHEGVKEYKDNAEKMTTLETEITSLKSQIDERDKDLEELKKVDAEGLQNKITELENKNKTLKEESDKQLLETRKSLMIENSLISSKAKNLKAIKGLLDLDKISFENDKLKGLDEQITSLQKSDAYLFNLETDGKTVDLGGDHKKQAKTEPTTLAAALHEKYDK